MAGDGGRLNRRPTMNSALGSSLQELFIFSGCMELKTSLSVIYLLDVSDSNVIF